MTETDTIRRAGWAYHTDEGWIHCRPGGPAAAMTWRNIADITNFLYDTPTVKLFVEFGANYAGLGILLVARVLADPTFAYIGIEKETDRVPESLLRAAGNPPLQTARFFIADGFDAGIKQAVAEAFRLCRGRGVMFCDGTNKPREMREYAPVLRTGDYLMVHDFWDEAEFLDIKPSPGNATTSDVRAIERDFGLSPATPRTWARAHGLYLMRKVPQ